MGADVAYRVTALGGQSKKAQRKEGDEKR